MNDNNRTQKQNRNRVSSANRPTARSKGGRRAGEPMRKSAQENKRHSKGESFLRKAYKGFDNFKKNADALNKQRQFRKKKEKQIKQQNDRLRRIEQQERIREQEAKRQREEKLRNIELQRQKRREEILRAKRQESREQKVRQPVSHKSQPKISRAEEISQRKRNYEKNRSLHEKQQDRLYKSRLKKQKAKEKELDRQLKAQEKQAKRRASRTKAPKEKSGRLEFFSIRAGMDMPFLILTLVLVAIGLVMMFSASYANAYYIYNDSYKFIKAQLPMAILGVVLMIAISYVDYHHIKRLATPALILSFVLLIAVLLMPAVNQVHRWIQLGPLSFQASEITKFAIILFFAAYISRNFNAMDTLKKGILPFLCVLIPTLLLLYLEPHISCIVIVVLLTAIVMFIGGTKLKWFTGAIGAIVAVGLYIVIFTDKFSYANDRISSWIDPLTFVNSTQWQDTWQTRNSLYAIGSGGLMGLGLGNSRQKYMYLPEPQNDFIFAIVCEELGYIGALIVLILFALLVWRGITLSMRAQDKFGVILGIGITAQIGIQAVLNIAVVTNSIPNTGISLPFFSYGGTSLMMLLMQMGIVLSISRTSNIQKI